MAFLMTCTATVALSLDFWGTLIVVLARLFH